MSRVTRAIARVIASSSRTRTASSSEFARATSVVGSVTDDSFTRAASSTGLQTPFHRGFAADATTSARSAYGVTDDNAYTIAEDELELVSTSEGESATRAKPTKRKNHIKRMAQRDAFRKENARVHKENKQKAAILRQEKRIERWRAAAARRREDDGAGDDA